MWLRLVMHSVAVAEITFWASLGMTGFFVGGCYGLVWIIRRDRARVRRKFEEDKQAFWTSVRANDDSLAERGRICVGIHRGKALGYAAVLGVSLVIGVPRASGVSATIALIVLGLPFAFFVWEALRQRPVLILDEQALTDARAGRTLRWTDVEEVYARARQGAYGMHHELVLTSRKASDLGRPKPHRFISRYGPDDELTLSLDDLALPWERIVWLVEERIGHPVPIIGK